jgi:hypothetical protein
MKSIITTLTLLFILTTSFAQEKKDIIGTWTYNSVTTTNENFKDVDYFPINSFKFLENGIAEFTSAEGLAKSSYKIENNSIILYDLIENGVQQEGSNQLDIKSMTKTDLTLTVKYECGSIDIIFNKK